MNYRLIDNTYVQRSEIHGWGVFAKADIKEGDVIMECVIPMEGLDGDMMLMRGYRFSTENDGEDTIPLGNAAVINYIEDWLVKIFLKIQKYYGITSKVGKAKIGGLRIGSLTSNDW